MAMNGRLAALIRQAFDGVGGAIRVRKRVGLLAVAAVLSVTCLTGCSALSPWAGVYEDSTGQHTITINPLLGLEWHAADLDRTFAGRLEPHRTAPANLALSGGWSADCGTAELAEDAQSIVVGVGGGRRPDGVQVLLARKTKPELVEALRRAVDDREDVLHATIWGAAFSTENPGKRDAQGPIPDRLVIVLSSPADVDAFVSWILEQPELAASAYYPDSLEDCILTDGWLFTRVCDWSPNVGAHLVEPAD